MIISDSILTFGITLEQAEKICKHFNKNLTNIQGYEVCELLDKIIDSLED